MKEVKVFTPFFIDIETTGLDPTTSRIVAIGYSVMRKQDVIICKDESTLIRTFIKEYEWVISELLNVVLVGYNIIGFDLPFMVLRGLKHGIPEVQGLRTGYIIDLMDIVSRYLTTSMRRYVKQKEICSFLGIRGNDVIDGSEIPLLFEQGEYELIKQHCLNDLELTKKLFERVKGLARHRLMAKYGFYQQGISVTFQ